MVAAQERRSLRQPKSPEPPDPQKQAEMRERLFDVMAHEDFDAMHLADRLSVLALLLGTLSRCLELGCQDPEEVSALRRLVSINIERGKQSVEVYPEPRRAPAPTEVN